MVRASGRPVPLALALWMAGRTAVAYVAQDQLLKSRRVAADLRDAVLLAWEIGFCQCVGTSS